MLASMGRGTRASEQPPARTVSNQPNLPLRANQTHTHHPPKLTPRSQHLAARRYLGIAASDMEAVVARGLSEARAIEHGVSSEAW